MKRLYEKDELLFAIFWIAVYVIGFSFADNLSARIGAEKSVTVFAGAFLSVFLFVWMKKNQLFFKYGLCKTKISAKTMLYYIPLILLTSVNLWHGVTMNFSVLETLFYIVSMFAVGFLEEIIFRGFLFQSMCKDHWKPAMIVSSVTFGIGHIVNLVNGSGADLFSNLMQVGYAIAAGFLFTGIFYKTKSLLPCIAAHSVLNALSVFVDETMITPKEEIMSAAALAGIAIIYAIYIIKIDDEDVGGNEDVQI